MIVEKSALKDYLPELQKSLGRCIDARDSTGSGGKGRKGRETEDGVMTEDALREIMGAEDASESIFKGSLQTKPTKNAMLQSVGEEEEEIDLGSQKKGIQWGLGKNETKSVHEVDRMIRDAVGGHGGGIDDDDDVEDNAEVVLNCKGVSCLISSTSLPCCVFLY